MYEYLAFLEQIFCVELLSERAEMSYVEFSFTSFHKMFKEMYTVWLVVQTEVVNTSQGKP